jgi:hypothetical protein
MNRIKIDSNQVCKEKGYRNQNLYGKNLTLFLGEMAKEPKISRAKLSTFFTAGQLVLFNLLD